MPPRRKILSWSATVIFGASILLALAQQQSPPAQAQDADEADPADTPPRPAFETPVVGPQGQPRFSLGPADTGAVDFYDLSTIEKEATDVAASIHAAEHPPESVAGWSVVSRQYAERAAVRRAEYEAGIAGMSDDLGVE